MKKSFYALLFISCTIAFACRHKKEVVQMTTVTVPAQQLSMPAKDSSRADIYRFIISFYSIGAGRDMDAYRSFKIFVSNYMKEHNVTIHSEEAPWGREGEVDYCMKLNELTTEQQEEFIVDLKKTLASAQWVHYFENVPCRNKRK